MVVIFRASCCEGSSPTAEGCSAGSGADGGSRHGRAEVGDQRIERELRALAALIKTARSSVVRQRLDQCFAEEVDHPLKVAGFDPALPGWV